MPLTDAERQKRYRDRIVVDGKKRFQVLVESQVAAHVHELCKLSDCTKGELISRLVEEEWERSKAKNQEKNK